jgi:hypothetical protein
VQLDIVDSSGQVVRELVSGKRLRRGVVTYTWNGRDDQGDFVREGVYKPRVHLTDQHRTIDLPNDMRVDTTAPKITVVSVAPREFSPDGDGRRDRVVVAYKTNEPAHGVLLVDGKRVVFTRRQLQRSSLDWNGKVDGKVLAPGVHRLQLAAEDRAGNLSEPGKPLDVVLRYVALARSRIKAKGGTRFGVKVSADASVEWRLGTRRGEAKPGLLVVRAPGRAGHYTLVVRAGDHAARAAVIVGRR